jgi:hypothetical protein
MPTDHLVYLPLVISSSTGAGSMLSKRIFWRNR